MPPDDPPPFPPFEVLRTEHLYESIWVALRRDRVRAAPDLTLDYHVVEIPDAVCVVPLRSDGRIAMVGQYRYPHGKTHWEFPAGRLEPDESPEHGARRELREETGHVARDLVELPGFYPINGISDHWCHLYVALGCEETTAPALEPTERIVPRTFEVAEVEELVRAGRVEDGFSALAFLRARLHGHV